MKNEKHLSKSIYKTFPVLLILFIFYIAATPQTAFGFLLSSPASKIENSFLDDFDKKFREGRELIDKEEWAQAAQNFRELIEKYPDGKSADAAFYWLAFCHKKQKQFKEADAVLNRLIEKFPASSWAADARVMRLEIAAPLGRMYSSNVPTPSLLGASSITSPSSLVIGTPVTAIAEYNRILTAGVYSNDARPPLDREDEIKIAAFQSLLAADPQRAIDVMGEILRTDSKSSDSLKQEVLRVLRSQRASRADASPFMSKKSAVGREFTPLLRETLMKSFQNETNPKIRKEIIYALANLSDQSAIDFLKKIYAADANREIKKAIINSLGATVNTYYGLDSNAAPKRKIESEFVFEILQTEKDSELRRLAFSNLQRFLGWAESQQSIDSILRLYDSETEEAFKVTIIRALSGLKQNRATAKILDIAKNDKSDKLRLEAIYSLRTSRDPAVLKFLEEMIK